MSGTLWARTALAPTPPRNAAMMRTLCAAAPKSAPASAMPSSTVLPVIAPAKAPNVRKPTASA